MGALLADGGTLTAPAELPDLRPGETAAVPLPFELPKDGGEAWLTLRVTTAGDEAWAPRGTVVCLPQVRLRAAEPVRHTPVTNRPVEVDEDGLLVHPLLAAAPTLSLWRAPTDNDELGGMAGRWRDWGLDALTRKVVAVRRDPGRVAVVADHLCPGGTVRHEQVFTAVEGGLLVEESAELPEALDDVARVGSVFETVAGLNLLEWFGQGPWESYPDRGAGAPVGHHGLPVDELFTPYLRPQESGGRHGVRRFTLSAPDATGLAVRLDRPCQVSVTRHRAADLASAAHHDELVPRAGCVVHIDAAHRGLGTASCGPDTFASYLVAVASIAGAGRCAFSEFLPSQSPHGAPVCTSHDHDLGEAPQAGAGRRSFLRATALLGATAGAVAALPAVTAVAAPSTWRPDPHSRRFTLAVMPDTQYLFDGPSIDKAPVEASLRYLLEHGKEENLVFLSHLGDLTQNGAKEEFAAIGEAFRLLDRRGVGYSVLAGNHDVKSSTTDQRGATPYLDAFGPRRFKGQRTFGGASPDGYNTFHLFTAGGREWMVLALDWRLSPQGYAWAKEVLAKHPKTPVILTTHELVVEDGSLSEYGQQLWDQLVEDHDQIFLTLNGHYWPAARATRKNAAGHDVQLHLTNYQNRYFGGAAMIRLYRFDLDRNVIDVETVSPWILGRAKKGLNELERQEMELSGDADRFSVEIDFQQRFSGFAPVPARWPGPPRSCWSRARWRTGASRSPSTARTARPAPSATCPGGATTSP